ncbi:MAG: hypothetical protein AAGJ82_14300, partial [Bacteroidota bacterium]
MPNIYQTLLVAGCLLGLFAFPTSLSAQFTEDFETETVGSNMFSGGGVAFTTTNPLDVGVFVGGGANGAGDDQFLEANANGNVGSVVINTAGQAFQMTSLAVYLSSNGGNNTADGLIIFRGTPFGGGTPIDVNFNVVHPGSADFAGFSFAGTALDGVNLQELAFITETNKDYLAIDNFAFFAVNPSAVNVSID